MAPPERQGLYDPRNEHDACGLGFVAHLRGARSHAIVADALTLLANLSHRGAAGADDATGDGAGILLQIPHAHLWRACAGLGVRLPDAGTYGVGMLFLPRDDTARLGCERTIERIAVEDGWRVLGWRDVPIDSRRIGVTARQSEPCIRQVFVARPGIDAPEERGDGGTLERDLYVLRKRLEQALRGCHAPCYVASLSSRTVVYKGMLHAHQLREYFRDLVCDEVVSGFAVVHSRFSTNTFPSWALAHPYRLLAHNGEINTIRGNVRAMQARESSLASPRFPRGCDELLPIVTGSQSDSASLDNAAELLMHAGRPLTHAMAMLLPEAWENDETMPADRRAFFEYHASLIEPWDGPAAVIFTDGRDVGATLDRNGLRPMRYQITDDDLVIAASEAGALEVPAQRVRAKGQLHSGQMLVVNTVQGRLLLDDDIKSELASLRPYHRIVAEQQISLPAAGKAPKRPRARLIARQRAFGYTREELKTILAPMAEAGEEAIGSMGNDAPAAVLSDRPQLLFSYFRQMFAQVTNPPIDPIRERHVMSLATWLGPRGNLLDDGAPGPRHLRLAHPILSPDALASLRGSNEHSLKVVRLRTVFAAARGPGALEPALRKLCARAERAVRGGASILVLSDRKTNVEWAPVPALLATAAVHTHLCRVGLYSHASIVADTGEARDSAQLALLLGFGAAAVCPYLAFETIERMVMEGALGTKDVASAHAAYVNALAKGLLKILSKMGISTVRSYCGAQLFEAVGLGASVIDRYFPGTRSPIGGVPIEVIARETLDRHRDAFATVHELLDSGSTFAYRIDEEHHHWNPRTIVSLQRAVRRGDASSYEEFSRAANADAARYALRGFLRPVPRTALPIDAVESETAIVRRFVTGAMSFGALSREAHETLAIAMNRIGARSNSGEGGEDPSRFATARASAIKQVASARFGVTTEYLVDASELQIKIAQGAKPGEGGQLPGHKVDEMIARTRCATAGVTLISPPPHHDIYSIEDLKQLIFDLANVNPHAAISVKLVASSGIGTIAAGVAKAHADLIVVAGDSGGTGASPLSSIKHTGVPWEIGLAEVQQTLLLNGLRDRVRLQVDGQLKTGHDVVIAALLGADEFGFATAPLIAQGCIMMRKCHLNTCPVGIATQDPELRAKFTGQPEHVINYFFFVAREVRAHMARLGFRSMREMIGQVESLRAIVPAGHAKARHLDLAALLHVPATSSARSFVAPRGRELGPSPDDQLLCSANAATPITTPVRNTDRAVGARLAGEMVRGRRDDHHRATHIRCTGSAGQSFGAFAVGGLTLELIGEANDYVGKGLAGGTIIVRAPHDAHFVPEATAIVGSTVLYGATSGEAYIGGLAGQRFAVRNSGAIAVVEGTGDHACEYMTGGVVVVLGRTGRNFAAGMSGGMAFVLDQSERRDFRRRCNTALVTLSAVETAEQRALLHRLVERHARYTNSARAKYLLSRWDATLADFVAIIPNEYRAALAARGSDSVSQREAQHG